MTPMPPSLSIVRLDHFPILLQTTVRKINPKQIMHVLAATPAIIPPLLLFQLCTFFSARRR
uniref:Uncharacterized protein n=1 Tax=Arundo donax TaxID=35708 RepID=A0A0A8XTC7_ARUDO